MPPVNSGWHVNKSGLNGTEYPAQHRGNWSLVDSVRGIDKKSRTDALGMRAYMAAPPAGVGSAFLHEKRHRCQADISNTPDAPRLGDAFNAGGG